MHNQVVAGTMNAMGVVVEADVDARRVTIAEGWTLREYEIGEDGRFVLVASVSVD